MARRAYHVRTENKFGVLPDMHGIDMGAAGPYIGSAGDNMRERFYVGERGIYYKVPYFRAVKDQLAGSLIRGISVTRFNGRDYYTKNLVYFLYHGEWPDYELRNYDGDPENNGVLNLLEEGETLIRLKCGLRFNPSDKKYYRRVYNTPSLKHKYVEVLKEEGYY